MQLEGDRVSWEDFYHTYKGFIISIGLKTGLNAHDAEDLMNQVFTEVHRKFISNTDLDFNNQSFGGWLGNLVKWRVKDFYRKRQKSPCSLDDDILTHLNPDQPFENIWNKEWQSKLIKMALTRVKESPRNLLIFVDLAIKEHSIADVCDRYNISRTNADTIKSRVMMKLAPIVQKLNQGDF